MTKAEAIRLAKRIEKWRDRLIPLGLGHWRIDEVSVVDETPGGPAAGATVTPSHSYDSARFWFTHSFLADADDRQLDETIIHEWLHVAMRDFDQAIESGEFDLASSARDRWSDWVGHEREGLIDKLARQIYALWVAGPEATPAHLKSLHY